MKAIIGKVWHLSLIIGLRFFDSSEESMLVNVTNTIGQVLLSKQIPNGLSAYSISTEGLTSGVYFVSVESGDSNITLKLVKR